MVIGTFWSQKDNKWVRFVLEDGVVHAESASACKDNPSLAEAWEPEADGIWSVNYSLGKEEPLVNKFYRVKDGILYHDTGINRYGIKIIEYRLPTRWDRYPESMKATFDPFSKVQKEEVVLLPYAQLPLPVEIQEERRREAVRLAQEAREAERQKWDEIKKGDFFGQFIDSVKSAFTSEQNASLYHELSKELLPFPISRYETAADFVELWSQALEDRESNIYNLIIRVASTTFLDEDFALNPDGDSEVRKWLFERKKEFCFAVINAGVEFVRDAFDLPRAEEQLEVLQIPLNVQVPVLDAQVKISVGQAVYKFFSDLLAAATQYLPNIFNWSKPARREDVAGDNRLEQHKPVVIDGSMQGGSLGVVSSQESWLSRKKAGELVQSSISYVSSLRSLFWSTPQPTDNALRDAPNLDADQARIEKRF